LQASIKHLINNYKKLSIMNHIQNYQHELYVPQNERDWLEWASAVERHLGHSLDGDLQENGYSLDRAYGWFLTGADWLVYAKEIKRMPNYMPKNNSPVS
jgi:hypothetical protein